jgi:hypothetical protein
VINFNFFLIVLDKQPKTSEPSYDEKVSQKGFAVKGHDGLNKFADKKPLNLGNIQSIQNKPVEVSRMPGKNLFVKFSFSVLILI